MQSHQRFSLAVSLIVTLIAIRWIGGSFANAQDQPQSPAIASSPTTLPELELPADSPFRKWFHALADADPQVRDQAAQDLMGISSDDLPKLRQLIIERQPLVPDQAAALKDIVTQAFLASQKYDVSDTEQSDASGDHDPFFLGLLWAPDTAADLGIGAPIVRLGVPVEERIPGFPSYRYLRRGDMILGIFMDPAGTLQQLHNAETHNIEEIKAAIRSSPRTQDIALQVLRNGEVLKVRLKMAPRPLFDDPLNRDSLDEFMKVRARNADRYWNENFAPLLGRHADEDAG